jgi:hypothetical protein
MHRSILELVRVVTFKTITLLVENYAYLLQYFGNTYALYIYYIF